MAEKTPFGLSSPTNREWNLDIEPNGNLTVNSGDVTGGTTRITINDNNGNVGIGTANPATRLEVDGWLTVGNEGDNSQINFEAANGRTAQIGVQDDSDQGFYVRTNGQYRMSVTQSGNVGIGTISPSKLFEVVAADDQSIRATASGGGQLEIGFHSHDYGRIQAYEASAKALALNPSGGNVGIGCTSPGAKLEITGSQNDEALTVTDEAGKQMLVIKDYHSGNTEATDLRAMGTAGGTGVNADGSVVVIPKTKDSNGINDAIDYIRNTFSSSRRGIVYLPEGSYTIDAQITVYEGIHLIGAGARNTILDASSLSDHAIVTQEADHTPGYWVCRYNIVLKGFKVIGNTTNRDYTGVYMQGVERCVIEDVWVEGAKTGFHVKGWADSIINCWADSCYTAFDLSWPDATYPEHTNAVSMRGCHFEGGTVAPPTSTISSGSFSSPRVTISTGSNHRLQNGGDATVSGCSNTSYNGTYSDVSVVSATQFTAVPVGFTPSGSASDGTVTGRIIGAYINGHLNSIIGCTIERRGDTTQTLLETIGVLFNGAGSTRCPNAIISSYFEGWKETFLLNGCAGTNIIGNLFSVQGTGSGVTFRSDAELGDHFNNLMGNFVQRWTWNGSSWQFSVSEPYGRVYAGLGSDNYVTALKLHNPNNPQATTQGVGIDFQLSTDYQDYKKAEIRAIATAEFANDIALTFWSGGSTSDDHQERMRITHDGKIGVGKTSPTEKLEVNGKIKVDAGTHSLTIEENDIVFNRNGTSYIKNNGGASSSIAFHANSVSKFLIADDVWAQTDLRVDEKIGIGLGAGSISEKLDVNGNINTSGDLKVGGTTVIDSGCFFRPVSASDDSAPSNSVYYSTTQAKLVYKDGGGVVRPLY